MSVFDVGKIVLCKKIKTRLEFLAYCNAQKEEGKPT